MYFVLMWGFRKTDFYTDLIANVFRQSIQKKQDYFRYFPLLFSVPSFFFQKNGNWADNSCSPSKDSLKYPSSVFKG